ncbi:MAG: type IV pilus modification protein PilV [Sideroxydans sp.]|nr:type IV pilus modification protein PilV [Sideroxydans sp.]
MKKTLYTIRNQHGFSMMEILVTLTIVATALLGTAGLQAHALKTSKGSEFRNQAIFLSADIVERMEANKAEAVAGNYAVAAGKGAVSTACEVVAACAGPDLTAYDLGNWQAAVAALPSGSGSIALTTAGNPATYTITVSWTDRGAAAAGQAGVVAGVGTNAAGVTAATGQEIAALTTIKIIRN